MYYDITQKPHGPGCKPGCSCGRFSEIWNDVFMQYNKNAKGEFEKLPQPNVDTGMGLERTLAVVNGLDDDYLTELWQPAIQKISQLSNRQYLRNEKSFRIIADHIRATAFVICDSVTPSNKERGYILRRLIRRATLQLNRLGIKSYVSAASDLVDVFVSLMSPLYPELLTHKSLIHRILQEEIGKFEKTFRSRIKRV